MPSQSLNVDVPLIQPDDGGINLSMDRAVYMDEFPSSATQHHDGDASDVLQVKLSSPQSEGYIDYLTFNKQFQAKLSQLKSPTGPAQYLYRGDDCLILRVRKCHGVTESLQGQVQNFDTPHCTLVHLKPGVELNLEMVTGGASDTISIFINPGYLADKLNTTVANLMAVLSTDDLFNVTPMSTHMATLLNDLQIHRNDDHHYKILAEAKCLELLSAYFKILQTPLQINKPNVKLSLRDQRLLEQARNLIEQDYANAPSLDDLAKRVGLNRRKLITGFKYLYGNTVYGYVLQLKMREAQRLLKEDQLNVSQVAQIVGYSDQSSFTQVYKRVFNRLPKEEAKQVLA